MFHAGVQEKSTTRRPTTWSHATRATKLSENSLRLRKRRARAYVSSIPHLGLLAGVALAVAGASVASAWPDDPAVNVPIAAISQNQTLGEQPMCSDGVGGFFVGWADERNGDADLYVQRMNRLGVLRWVANGVPFCTANGVQQAPFAVSDGTSGVILAWSDRRSGSHYDIYAQRMDGDGNALWTADGEIIFDAGPSDAFVFGLQSDGAGGAFVLIAVIQNLGDSNIVIARIDSGGNLTWGPTLETESNAQILFADLTLDGTGGAIAGWVRANWPLNEFSLFAHRIAGDGTPVWNEPTQILGPSGDAIRLGVVPDGVGGAIVAWRDDEAPVPGAQRVGADGTLQWGMNGVQLMQDNGEGAIAIASDEAGGAVVAADQGEGIIGIQRVDASGNLLWGTNGVQRGEFSSTSAFPGSVIGDGSGGFIVAWSSGVGFGSPTDIHVVRLDANGDDLWNPGVVALCTADEDQTSPRALSDGSSGAIVAWNDMRNGTDSDVYAQRVTADGELGPPTDAHDVPVAYGALALHQNVPNPFNPSTHIAFDLTGPSVVTLRIYDARGRVVRSLLESKAMQASRHSVTWRGRDDTGQGVASGTYFYEVEAHPTTASSAATLRKHKSMTLIR